MTKHIERMIEEKSASREELRGQISDLKAQVAELEVREKIISAELTAYEDALEHIKPRRAPRRSGDSTSGTRKRALSENWTQILLLLVDAYPAPLAGSQILEFAAQRNLSISPSNLRSQMSQYRTRGLIENPDAGYYNITAAGAKDIHADLTSDGDTVDDTSAAQSHGKLTSKAISTLQNGSSLTGPQSSLGFPFKLTGGSK